MAMPLLTTKLYVPPVQLGLVSRPRLIEQLNSGLHRKLTLISAPAGFGKTTLLSKWARGGNQRPSSIEEGSPPLCVAWLSLDEGDNDAARFLTYFIAALQRIKEDLGHAALDALQALMITT
jgi:LuxR family maltose regulon positive regulatory protein